MLIAITTGTMAQGMYVQDNEDPKRFNGGLIGGVNFTQVDGDSYYGYNKVGFNLGGIVLVRFSEHIGASMELLFSQKGSKGQGITESPYIGEYVAKYYMFLNYAEVPITLHLMFHSTDVELGASYAYLISSTEYVESDTYVPIDAHANRFNNTDLDGIIGITHKLYKKLYGNVRYEYSLTSIRPPERIPYGYSYGNQGQYNNLFNVRVVYYF